MVAGGMESMSNVPNYVSRDVPAYGGFKVEVCRKYGILSSNWYSCALQGDIHVTRLAMRSSY